MKIEQISDVKVKIDILRPQPIVGMGTPAIFVKGTKEACKVYKDIDTLITDFTDTSDVYKKASAIWTQNNSGREIIVITYVEGKIESAATNYFYEGWHFALLATYNAADALALSNLIEEQEFKFLVIQVATATELAQFAGNLLTIGYVHPLNEYLDAAIVGNTANLTVGSVTWKFRNGLKGIKAQELTQGQINEVADKGGIVYVAKAGIPQTSEGKTIGGEYIDALHGDHWVKANLETSIQNMLSTTDKLSFDASGIALLNAAASNALETAFTNGIIDANDETGTGNYTVTTLQRSDLDPTDIAARNYKGLSFTYKRSSAIHTVEVSGTIEV